MTKLLTQDDCAPDSLVYFYKGFKDITGMDPEVFREIAYKKIGDDFIEYHHGGFVLSFAADSPFWELSKK